MQLDPQGAVDARRADDFLVPFTYVLPTGAEFDYGTTNATYFEVRIPAAANAGHPAGVILQAIGGGRTDPCDAASSQMPIAAAPQAVIDYLKTVPGLEVTNESPTTVGALPAVEAMVVARPETPGCVNIWPWEEDTESIPREVPLRITAVDVGGEHMVFSVFGDSDNPGWTQLVDELIDSVRFEPKPGATVAGEVQVAEPFAIPFRYVVPPGGDLIVSRATNNMYALTNGATEPYPANGLYPVPGLRGIAVSFSPSPSIYGDPRTFGVSYGDSVTLRPDTFLADLSRNSQLSIGQIETIELGGLPASQADIDHVGWGVSTAYPYIELEPDGSLPVGYLNFSFPSRLIVARSEGGVVLVHIWAGTEEDFVAWIADATALVESITFGD